MNNTASGLARDISTRLRTVDNYPKLGVRFYDLTPVFLHGDTFGKITEALIPEGLEFDVVAGLDARGFLLAGAVAQRHQCGLLAVRKQGKLPPPVMSERYELEYGTNTLEIPDHLTAVKGASVLIVDDVLATGGTARAAQQLLTRAGGHVVGLSVVIDLKELKGKDVFTKPIWSLVTL